MKEESIKLNNNENTGDTLSHTIERSGPSRDGSDHEIRRNASARTLHNTPAAAAEMAWAVAMVAVSTGHGSWGRVIGRVLGYLMNMTQGRLR